MAARAFLPRTMRSAAFRFALLLALIFALGAAALLAAVERQIGNYATEATSGMLKAESAILAGEYAQLGQSGLIDALERHQAVGAEAQFRYLLVDPARRRLFGDLPMIAIGLGWRTFDVVEKEGNAGQTTIESMTALGRKLPGGMILVVATDNFDVQAMRRRLDRFTIASGIGIALFALLGGYVTGRLFLRRLGDVNHAVDRIIEGDRSERLPPIGFGPEFDQLTVNLNRMLDRNATSMEALRQVSTDIAHDLRTPLTRLHQRLEQMRDEDDAGAAAIDDALAQTDGLLTTFQALLRIGTMEGGVGRQRFAPVDLSELMDRIHQAYQPVAEDGAHSYRADHVPGVSIEGDGELLAQLFTNLIENAIVHTPSGTTITSRLYLREGVPVAEICDDGPGIPRTERMAVFRRFYRRDASRNTDGAGLGLALVAAIASLHRAECSIVDEAGGLCVRIVFLA
jgi:signal transduction histidine kinase